MPLALQVGNGADLNQASETALSCTIVICTRDRPEKLDRCLRAIAQLHEPHVDILVVDNAPADGRTKEVALRWGVRYCVEPVLGLSRARNRGARESESDVVAYLDDDSICMPDWLSSLVREFQDPRVMAVAGLVVPVGAEGIDRDRERVAGERRVIDRGVPAWFEMSNFGGVGIGANMAFRREAFDRWPGFDVRLGRGTPMWGGEENYAFFSLVERGHRVVSTPHVVVRHSPHGSSEECRARALKDIAARSAYVALLLAERPAHMLKTLRYVFEALRQVKRHWRHPGETPTRPEPAISGFRKMAAYMSGPMLYLRASLQKVLCRKA